MPINTANGALANGAPRYAILDNKTANGETMYGNTTADAFVTGQTVGVYAVDATEMGVSSDKVLRIKIVSGGTGYANGNLVRVTGATTNANAAITTNSTGGIVSFVIGNTGVGVTRASTLSIVNSTFGTTGVGTDANLVYMLGEGDLVSHSGWVLRREGSGNRAGRVTYEVLVAGGVSSDGSDDTQLPDS
jgi:hypothetical protein